MEKQFGLSYASIENGAKHGLLQNFITEFLPKSNYRGMYRYNEFSNLYSILEKVFSHKAHIKIEPEELAACLNAAGYHCYITGTEYKGIKKSLKPFSICAASNDYFFNYSNDFLLFVNVSSKDVRYLKRAMRSVSLQKKSTEIVRLRVLKRKIKNFISHGIFE